MQPNIDVTGLLAELAAVSDPRRAFRNVNTAKEYANLMEEPENAR